MRRVRRNSSGRGFARACASVRPSVRGGRSEPPGRPVPGRDPAGRPSRPVPPTARWPGFLSRPGSAARPAPAGVRRPAAAGRRRARRSGRPRKASDTVTAPHPTAGDLTHLVKAYDVRGVVPDQLDERIAEALGGAFVRVVGAKAVTIGWDMHAVLARRSAAAFARGAAAPGRRRDRHRPGLHRPALLRLRPPRPARRDVHRQPQPGQIQRDQVLPGRRGPGRPGHRAERDSRPGRPASWPRPAPFRRPNARARSPTQDLLGAYAAYMRGLVDISAATAR